MPADPLREKLRRLVEEWRRRDQVYGKVVIEACADQLAALLAESDPGPLGHEFVENPDDTRHCYHTTDEQLEYGGSCGESPLAHKLKRPDFEAKAKLPLGHEFVACTLGGGPSVGWDCHYPDCGQPRSAHEVKP